MVAFCTALVLLILGCNHWWLNQNELPDGFQNEYEHVYTLTEVYFRLRDNSLADAWRPLWTGYYPPMGSVVGSLGMSVFGRSIPVAVASLSVFWLALIFATARLGFRLGGIAVTPLAFSLTALYPGLYGNARRFEPNTMLAGMVALTLLFLATRPARLSKRDALLLGLLCGLGMLSDRVVFGVYVFLPVLSVIFAGFGDDKWLSRSLFSVLIASVGSLAVAGYFYAHFISGHVAEVTSQIGGEIAHIGDGSETFSILSFRGLFYYPMSWITSEMGGPLALVTLLGLGLYIAIGRRGLPRRPRRILELALFGGLFIITLVGKKQAYYGLPLLGPAAVLAAAGWTALFSSQWTRVGLLAFVLSTGGYQLALKTFGPDQVPAPGRWGLVAGLSPLPPGFLGSEYTMAAAPQPLGLRASEMALQCRAHQASQALTGPAQPVLLLFSDSPWVYEGQLMPTMRLAMDSLLVEGAVMSPEAFAEQVRAAGCFVFVTDSDSRWPSEDQIRAQWTQWGMGHLGDEFFGPLGEMHSRVMSRESWATGRSAFVHFYTLAESGGLTPK